VTLIASSPCFTRQTDWDCALDAALLDSFGAELALDRERCLRRFVALQMQGESDARRLARALWQQLLATRSPDQEVLRFGLELLGNLDLRAGMAALEQPLKLILGEHDRLVPIALRQQIAEVAPGIQVESVAGAAHAPFLSNPQAIAACL
jgi:pimeloyl-[acyl-carrier protein] methyl ester esterase